MFSTVASQTRPQYSAPASVHGREHISQTLHVFQSAARAQRHRELAQHRERGEVLITTLDEGSRTVVLIVADDVPYLVSTLNARIAGDWGGARLVVALLRVLAGVVFAFYMPWLSIALYALVAAMWLVPDRRIERTVRAE